MSQPNRQLLGLFFIAVGVMIIDAAAPNWWVAALCAVGSLAIGCCLALRR